MFTVLDVWARGYIRIHILLVTAVVMLSCMR